MIYWYSMFYSGLRPDPSLAGRAGKGTVSSFPFQKGFSCHSVKGCPDACASSVLSLDSVPAPNSDASFTDIGIEGMFGTFSG